MTEERDEKVTAAYRALGAEEPPRALDDAILAASRLPAVKPWTKRYAVPLSLAAVLVLSITVTLRIQHEAPDIESPVAVREQSTPQALAPAETDAQAALKLKQEDRLKPAAPRERAAAKAESRVEPAPFDNARRDAAPAAKASAPAPSAPPLVQGRIEEYASRADTGRGLETSVAGAVARQTEERVARDAEAASRAPQVGPLAALAKRSQASADTIQAPAAKPAPQPMAAAAPAAAPALSPAEQEFERIAQLRRDGRHEDADKAFLEFRKRYPDFRISEDMLRRIERR